MKGMKYYLTSNPVAPDEQSLNPSNAFVKHLQKDLPEKFRFLFVCSDPNSHADTDYFGQTMRTCFENSGFAISDFRILDGRNENEAERLVKEADCLLLAGGHVPTQNAFFHKIALDSLLKKYSDKLLIGFSAGSMNCATEVYAQPELEGEAISSSYQRFLKGLGITKRSVLPHFSDIREGRVDGLRVLEDITYLDSMGRAFYAINDGSYLYGDGEREYLFGEAYRIADGEMLQICAEGQSVLLTEE